MSVPPGPLDPAKTSPLETLGQMFHSRYRLIKLLDRGGMGVVWRAEDTKLHRTVALKFLPELVVHDREAMVELAAETRRCLDLTHPHIVRVYDLVEERDQAAISMEFVDGGSLGDRKLREPGRCFTPEGLATWVAQLCSALDYAHTKVRIVHRDLKPLNLLVNSDGDLKVVDFGIARSLQTSETRLTMPARSTAVSLAYAGPQQLLGECPAVSDDIYSLGATLYDLLTSKPPFFDGDISTQVREVVPPSMTARRAALGIEGRGVIPPEWEETIAACLSKRTSDRPKSAAEVAARLGLPLLGIHSQESGTPFRTASLPPQRRSSRWLWLGAGTAAVLAALVTAYLLRNSDSASGAAARSPLSFPRSREVLLTVNPPAVGARAWIGPLADLAVPDDGRLVVTSLPDGVHELVVQAAGYQSAADRVTVQAGRGAAVVRLTAVYGQVEVSARPGSLVTALDARDRPHALGSVPATGVLRVGQTLTVGTYTFVVTHPDCGDIRQSGVVLAVGRTAKIAPEQAARPAELRVFSVPSGADVIVNGKKACVTPATLPTLPSEKPLAIEVFLPGHRRLRSTATLRPGETRTIDAGTLAPESGGIEFRLGTAPLQLPGVTVRIDGREAALVQGRVVGLEVGPHAVEIIHRNYENWKGNVTVRDGAPTPTVVKLLLKPVPLTLTVTGPASFKLSANGKEVPVRNGRALLPPEENLALEFSAQGFRTDRRNLTLPAGRPQTLAVRLEPIPGPVAGQPWRIAEPKIVFQPITPGTFVMGSTKGNPEELPLTKVTLRHPFWLGQTEVTQSQWQAVMGTRIPSDLQAGDQPAQNVTWNEAVEFCRRLTERERQAERLPANYAYALPSEAQWEYACRAGASEDLPSPMDSFAWHMGNSDEETHPVATKQPNAWGLYDMHGNVWEWCSDWFADKLPGRDMVDPTGPAIGDARVRRSGSCLVEAHHLRASFRGIGKPDLRRSNIGFRIALLPARPEAPAAAAAPAGSPKR